MANDFYKDQRSSQAFQKFINYTENLKNNPSFASEMRWFRRHHVSFDTIKPIPDKGLPFPESVEKHRDNMMEFHYMEKCDDYMKFTDFQNKKWAFEEKYGLNLFGEAFEFLLFYNSVEPMRYDGYSSFATTYDLVRFNDIGFGTHKTKEEADRYAGMFLRTEVAPITPVAICVNAYMTERDIIDFVKKVYKTGIEPIQKEYRKKHIKLRDARTKSKHKQSRNEFIYENRHLPITELTSLVTDKFGKVFDYTYIQTIIRKEEEKRN